MEKQNLIQNKTKQEVFIDFFSGLLGGIVSVTACSPLDMARTRLNVQMATKSQNKYDGFMDCLQKIQKEEGFRGFYKGYRASLISFPIFHSIFFPLYDQIKRITEQKFNKNAQYLISSVTTGLVCNIITNPIWIIRTRLQVQYLHNQNDLEYRGIKDTFQQMLKKEGWRSLYKGLGVSIFGLSHVAIYFPIYENLKIFFTKIDKNNRAESKEVFFSAVIAKMIASSITYPHIVLRVRQFDNRQSTNGQNYQNNLFYLIRSIYQKEGLNGFYSGLKVDLIRVIPNNTITFLVYESTKNLLTDLCIKKQF